MTWCIYHETISAGRGTGTALVVYLDGSVDRVDATQVSACLWRMQPKKS